MEKDVTDVIERLGAFEDRVGVSLDGLYASVDDRGWLRLNGEVHPQTGTELSQDIEIIATAHDRDGRVLDMTEESIWADEFFGFHAFSLILRGVTDVEVTKIRVYPKLSS